MKNALLAALLASAALSACGHKGDLERPAPWFGEDERTPTERQHETNEGDDAEQPQR